MTTPWVRLVLAISLDGRIAFSYGGASFLGGDLDRRLLEESLAWSDGALIGAGTLRVHRSTCLIKDSDLVEQRLLARRPRQPVTLVVTRRGIDSSNWPFFKQPIPRWLLSPPSLNDHEKGLLEGYERQLFLKSNWSETIKQLNEEGLSKLVVLGGAKLATSLIQEDVIDELQLTLSSRLLGGNYSWISTHRDVPLPDCLSQAEAWILEEVQPLDRSELLIRYIRNRLVKSEG